MDKREPARFGPRVMLTNQFSRSWQGLTPQMQHLARQKIRVLTQNRRHPSLRAHPLHRMAGLGLWECVVSRTHRLIYRHGSDGLLWLCDIGGHQVVDRCHLWHFRQGWQREG